MGEIVMPNLLEELTKAFRGEVDQVAKDDLVKNLNELELGAEVVGNLNDHPALLALLLLVKRLKRLLKDVGAEHNRLHQLRDGEGGEASPEHKMLHAQAEFLIAKIKFCDEMFWDLVRDQFKAKGFSVGVYKDLQVAKTPPEVSSEIVMIEIGGLPGFPGITGDLKETFRQLPPEIQARLLESLPPRLADALVRTDPGTSSVSGNTKKGIWSRLFGSRG